MGIIAWIVLGLVLQSGFVIFPVSRAGHHVGTAWSCAW
jgi:hypothetical protein